MATEEDAREWRAWACFWFLCCLASWGLFAGLKVYAWTQSSAFTRAVPVPVPVRALSQILQP